MGEAAHPRFVPAPPGSSQPDLYRKLLALTGLRLLVGTALLVATGVLSLAPGSESIPGPVERVLYFVIGIIYLGSLISTWFLRSGRYLRAVAHAQIVGDVIAASGLVYLTGGAESAFTILYPLAIVNAAIGIGRRGAVLGAVLSAVAFCTLAVGIEWGWLGQALNFADRAPLPPPRLALSMATTLSAFLLTAMLSSYMATALQGAQQELKGLEALHFGIVRSVASGIITTDASGAITFANPAFEKLTGRRAASLLGRPLREEFPQLASAQDEGELALADRTVHFAPSPLEEGGGRVVVLNDLTELRRMEAEVRRADRLAALGKLSAGLAHEIRNPLASMCGSIALLGKNAALGEKERRLLQIVVREGERLEGLVTEFLQFARPAQPQLADVDFSALVEETLQVFRADPAARDLRLEVKVMPGVQVRADAAQVRQVLWNLLSNACEAAAGGRVQTRLSRVGDLAVLEVEDDGPGIPEEDLPRIFDPFFTTKAEGTGLGLAVVHRIVEAHTGQMAVRSTPGKTVFTVALHESAATAAA